MIIHDTPKSFSDFLYFLSTKKRNLKSWSYLHIECLVDKENILSEIVQFVGFEMQDIEVVVYKSENPQELILVADENGKAALITFEQKIYSTFPSDTIRAITGDFSEVMIDRFRTLCTKLAKGNPIAELEVKRFCRLSNTIMVLDDDIMITKQVEKALEGFGTVITLNNHSAFIEQYRMYAPNVLFLDVHLGKVRGPNILDKFFSVIDPHAHVIIISSDSGESTIREVKSKGAHGFIVKPFNRQKLISQIMASPTFYAKT